MTSRDLIKNTILCHPTSRIPWVPYVGCHGASLIGATADKYLRSSDLMFDGLCKAIDLYKPDGIPVSFDLQIEAEALGCRLAWSEQNPPAVMSHPLEEGVLLSELKIPEPSQVRIPQVLRLTRSLREKYPDLALYGLITGPFTLALHLMGTEIFTKMMMEPDSVEGLMKFTTEVAKTMADYYIEAGVDVVAVVDPMVSQIDPYSFETFVSKPAAEVFSHIRERETLSSFFVCGYAQHNIELMCACRPDNISVDENIPLDFVRDIALPMGVSYGGNMKLTTTMLLGTPEDVERDAVECLDLRDERGGFVLAPGCDLPMATPSANLQVVAPLIRDKYRQDVLRASEATQAGITAADILGRYDNDKIIIDIITLDSESCAPCQYMVEFTKNVASEYPEKVIWHEHKIKNNEGLSIMVALGVKNIPTLCINGNIEFVSNIPSASTLKQRIDSYL